VPLRLRAQVREHEVEPSGMTDADLPHRDVLWTTSSPLALTLKSGEREELGVLHQ